jgi:hypothetical protein
MLNVPFDLVTMHLAVTLCRYMNIRPAMSRAVLVTSASPGSKLYLGDHWHTFDARHSCRRIGRVLIARGRDAADVPITMTFGKNCLTNFKVVTEELDWGNVGALADFGAIRLSSAKDQKTLFPLR